MWLNFFKRLKQDFGLEKIELKIENLNKKLEDAAAIFEGAIHGCGDQCDQILEFKKKPNFFSSVFTLTCFQNTAKVTKHLSHF